MSLVSDDDKNGAWNANSGVALPGNMTAIYNGALSPLFYNRSGAWSPRDLGMVSRGGDFAAWSTIISYYIQQLYRLYIGSSGALPSQMVDDDAQSLRCLVSTNNG